ncbi:PDZ domain-containing protein [Lacibacter cauensis]|uniref:PDZ domain-containing protein n=1 Tax=Lacibacter cauensis TaxID=510947 RepID=A0A562SPC7_9BACT|nr:aspartyl protease family protein [Lacibacter cauensis]TWI83068.1 PDZ domain-containing protein [Lacibacter cauensis]
MNLIRTICLLLLCGKLLAQDNDFPPARLLTSFRFEQLSGGIIVLHATLNNLPDTLNFILDSGSGGISLDTLTALYYKLTIEPSDRTVRGIGGIKPIQYYKNGTLHFPGLDVTNLDFHINDYEILTSVYGLRVDGIIGYSFLRRYIVALDYDKQMMSVYTPGAYKYPKNGTVLKPSFASIPITTHQVQDERTNLLNLYFDTGAGLCVLLSERLMKDSAFLSKNKKSVNTQVEGLIGKINMRLTTMKKMRIGRYKFSKVPIHVYDDSLNVLGYPSVAGLLGSDLLRRFNIVFNYPERLIHLSPNSHMRDAFDYSYTGMNYYFIDGKVVITEIQQGSPAEQAGLMPGDVIFGIENNFSNNINQYKLLLQHPGQKVRILIFRNTVPNMIELKVGSILK